MRNFRNRFALILTIPSMVALMLAIAIGLHFVVGSPNVSGEMKGIASMVALAAFRQLAAAIESIGTREKAERARRATNRVAQKIDNLDNLEDRLTIKMGAMIRDTISEILTGPNGLETRINKRFDTFGKEVDAKLEVMSARLDKEIAAVRHKAEGTINMLQKSLAHTEGERDVLEKKVASMLAVPPPTEPGQSQ
jgi:hypothetical protein